MDFKNKMSVEKKKEYPAQPFASHSIRIATIVIYLVLQRKPTHVNSWAGYSAIAPVSQNLEEK